MIALHNGIIVNEGRVARGWVAVEGELIADTGLGDLPEQYSSAQEVINLGGSYLFPGAIDEHVHFREPGLTDKGTIATESAAAVLGGVTSFMDMPNTIPATTTLEAWQAKMERASQTSLANYGFYLGATNDNLATLLAADYSRVAGVKVFMGSSTGGMLVDSRDTLSRIFSEVKALIAVHAECEDIIQENARKARARYGDDAPIEAHTEIRSAEACALATAQAVELARATGGRLHITHISTAAELEYLTAGDDPAAKQITAETCPQYLLFSCDDFKRLGARIKCNPAIKTAADSKALRAAVLDGRIDTIATDHAPHLLSSKEGGALKAASGMPGVQFSVPLMLDIFSPELVAEKMCHNPARVFGIDRRGFIRKGYYADLAVVEDATQYDDGMLITDGMSASRCGWTPYNGYVVGNRVSDVMVNGAFIVRGGSLLAKARKPMPLAFNRK